MFLFSFANFNIFVYIGIILIFIGVASLIIFSNNENYGNNQIRLLHSIKLNILHIKNNSSIKIVIVIKMLSSIFIAAFLIVMPYKFTEILKFETNELPYLYFLCTFFIYLGTLIYRRLIKKNSDFKIYKYNLMFGIIANIIFYISNTLIVFVIGIFMFEVFFIIDVTSSSSWAYNYLTNENKGSIISAISALSSAARGVYFVILGYFLNINLIIVLLLILSSIFLVGHFYNKLNKNI